MTLTVLLTRKVTLAILRNAPRSLMVFAVFSRINTCEPSERWLLFDFSLQINVTFRSSQDWNSRAECVEGD